MGDHVKINFTLFCGLHGLSTEKKIRVDIFEAYLDLSHSYNNGVPNED